MPLLNKNNTRSFPIFAAVVLASLLSLTLATHAPADPAKESPELKARIARIENGLLPPVIVKGQTLPAMTVAERMKFYKVPGVSIAFFENGHIAWTRTYGYADVATQRPVTPDTMFQAASISKPTSALAALKLVEEGKLHLDENVNDELRGWKVPDNDFTREQKVTLRRILSHTAGLTVHGFAGYAQGEPLPTVPQILNGEKPANSPAVRVDTVPGTHWSYSGGGYVIMQLLMTEATGEPYPKIMHDLVLEPAGMKHSTYQQPLPADLVAQAAIPYLADGSPVPGGAHTYPEMSPAGLWTTPSDLARVAIEVQKEYAGKSHKILSEKMMHEMMTRQMDNWGLGYEIEAPGHARHFGHGGSNEGFKSDLEAYTDSQSDEGVAIMVNSDNGQIRNEIVRAIAREYNWPDFQAAEHSEIKLDPKVFDAYVGQYRMAPDAVLSFTRDGDHFFMQSNDHPKQEIFPESERVFFSTVNDSVFSFIVGGQDQATEVIAKLNGPEGPTEHHAKRVETQP